jgi:hypothetical protein
MMKSGKEADKTYRVILPCSLLYAIAWHFSVPLCNLSADTWFKVRSMGALPHLA